jgi:hypothetical protein
VVFTFGENYTGFRSQSSSIAGSGENSNDKWPTCIRIICLSWTTGKVIGLEVFEFSFIKLFSHRLIIIDFNENNCKCGIDQTIKLLKVRKTSNLTTLYLRE